jgi:hypothetical protein
MHDECKSDISGTEAALDTSGSPDENATASKIPEVLCFW